MMVWAGLLVLLAQFWTPEDSVRLDSFLVKGAGFAATDLRGPRWWDRDSFELPAVRSVVEAPDRGLRFLDGLIRQEHPFHAWVRAFLGKPRKERWVWQAPPRASDVPLLLYHLGVRCDTWLRRMERWVPDASVQDSLLAAIPAWILDEDAPGRQDMWGLLNRELGRSWQPGDTLSDTTLLRLSRAIPVVEVASLALEVDSTLMRFMRRLRTAVGRLPMGMYQVGRCRILVGSWNEDRYTELDSFHILIEPGGDDRYENVPRGVRTLQVVLDLGGNDVYRSDRLGAPAGAVQGVAWIVDDAGQDVYIGGDVSLGAAVMGAAGLRDLAGDDVYRGGTLTEGAAFWGVGWLEDQGEGRDLYEGVELAQAVAGVRAVGVLHDGGGADLYQVGGVYAHTPLQPDFTRSLGQGFATGVRPYAAGGAALLLDDGGNDLYRAEIYGQGVAYWKALGVLVDRGGNDRYLTTQYGQGAGIHLAAGILVDVAGRDVHFSRFGPALGEGHDLSFGLLLDRRGDDRYHVSGGLGVGLTNSVGILMDLQGNDVYRVVEPLGLGDASVAREMGGLGVFLDLSGADRYAADTGHAGNAQGWSRGEIGVGWDVLMLPDTQPTIPPDTHDLAFLRETEDLDTLYQVARAWGVGSNRLRVKAARTRLAELGDPAFAYLFPEKLQDPYPLNDRLLKAVVKAKPDEVRPYLHRALRHPADTVRAMAMRLLAEIQDTTVIDTLVQSFPRLKGSFVRRLWLRAAAAFASPKVLSLYTRTAQDSSPVIRAYTARALGKLMDHQEARDLGVALMRDSVYLVASAAAHALKQWKDPDPLLGLEQLNPCTGHTCVFWIRWLLRVLKEHPDRWTWADRVRLRRWLDLHPAYRFWVRTEPRARLLLPTAP